MMTVLQIGVGDPTGGEIVSEVWLDPKLLREDQKTLLRDRVFDGAVYRLEYGNLINGERFSSSFLQRSPRRLRAACATAEALLSALEEDEARLRAVPIRICPSQNSL